MPTPKLRLEGALASYEALPVSPSTVFSGALIMALASLLPPVAHTPVSTCSLAIEVLDDRI
jgi:hypothetical protein